MLLLLGSILLGGCSSDDVGALSTRSDSGAELGTGGAAGTGGRGPRGAGGHVASRGGAMALGSGGSASAAGSASDGSMIDGRVADSGWDRDAAGGAPDVDAAPGAGRQTTEAGAGGQWASAAGAGGAPAADGAGPACECATGPCCDGCHFKTKGTLCLDEKPVVTGCTFYTRPTHPGDPVLEQCPQYPNEAQRDFFRVFCSGLSAACDGNTFKFKSQALTCDISERCTTASNEDPCIPCPPADGG